MMVYYEKIGRKEKRLLVDCHLLPEERKKTGIKYFCFDT